MTTIFLCLAQVTDGYNAPVTAGNFIDLVSKKFYDGLTIQRADGFIVQTGDPDGPVRHSIACAKDFSELQNGVVAIWRPACVTPVVQRPICVVAMCWSGLR